MKRDTSTEAYEKGKAAARQSGKSKSNNPYEAGTMLHSHWRKGYFSVIGRNAFPTLTSPLAENSQR